jgi:hypothetical protein
MTSRRILVVCMVNSIHSARWLAQFDNPNLMIRVFPSNFFKKVHPEILRLEKIGLIEIVDHNFFRGFLGFFDHIFELFLSRVFKLFTRQSRLSREIRNFSPQIVHALEFQSAGYLCLDYIEKYGKDFILISTNWGSDIYHFQAIPEHREKIVKLLEQSDRYSSECERDYSLAEELGFTGINLPVIPNSGGFLEIDINLPRVPTSERNLILVKGYGGYFGRCQLVVSTLYKVLNASENEKFLVHFFSVSFDVVGLIENLQEAFPNRITYTTIEKPLSHFDLQNLFSVARIYIGCSISDGVSTSFLEALVGGAYPIQTNTSCAGEWVKKGAVGTLINLDEGDLRLAINSVIHDSATLDFAQKTNNQLALNHLEYSRIKSIANSFYV